MRYCAKCVMPETSESLTYDAEGVCSVCRQIEFKAANIDWTKRMVELDSLLDPGRGKQDYDCIVPFSGGKDSTFTLWYLVTQKHLKPLVVRFDHGFLRPKLQENALKTFRTLGVDVHQFSPNWKVVQKLMFESLRRRGDFCWHCHTGIFAYPMWVALRNQIPLVIWGEPSAEYASFYGYDENEEVDERRFNLATSLGINAEDMVGMLDNSISSYPVTARDLKPFTYPPLAELRRLKMRSFCLGSFIPWDVKKQSEIIHRELGWEGDEVEGVPPEYYYEKIECYMQGVRDWIRYLKRGFGRTTHLASIDIRNGRMSREEAVELVKEYDGQRPHALDAFLRYLNITEEKFLDIVKEHVVAPNEMPSCESCMQKKSCKPPADFDQLPMITGDRERDRKLEPLKA